MSMSWKCSYKITMTKFKPERTREPEHELEHGHVVQWNNYSKINLNMNMNLNTDMDTNMYMYVSVCVSLPVSMSLTVSMSLYMSLFVSVSRLCPCLYPCPCPCLCPYPCPCLCPYPCPCLCPSSCSCSCSFVNFCFAYFNGNWLHSILIYCQKNQWITFKVIFENNNACYNRHD
jgi:hypothetical protein